MIYFWICRVFGAIWCGCDFGMGYVSYEM